MLECLTFLQSLWSNSCVLEFAQRFLNVNVMSLIVGSHSKNSLMHLDNKTMLMIVSTITWRCLRNFMQWQELWTKSNLYIQAGSPILCHRCSKHPIWTISRACSNWQWRQMHMAKSLLVACSFTLNLPLDCGGNYFTHGIWVSWF